MEQNAQNDSSRFAILKNLKAYRDAHSMSGDDSAFGDSGYTSSHFSSYSQEQISVKQSSSVLETIDEEDPLKAVLTTPPSEKSVPSSSIITPTTANMHKIMKLHITTPTEEKLLEPKTPQSSVNNSVSLLTGNTTPRKAKMGRKRSLVEESENLDCSMKRPRVSEAVKAKDDTEVLARRMPFSPVNARNNPVRALSQRSVSDNNLIHRSSTPKAAARLRRKMFAATSSQGNIKTPEKMEGRMSFRRFQSFSPKSSLLHHPYKKMALDAPGSSDDLPKILKDIPECAEEKPEEVRDCVVRNISLDLEDASQFIEESFNVSPIKPSLNFDKLFAAPILASPAISSFQTLDEKTDEVSRTSKTETSPSKREMANLLYADLPQTPPKGAKFKRTKSRTTPAKKATNFQKRTDFFDTLETLDILSRLKGVPAIIDQIFQHLSDEDLLNAFAVSSSWKSLIESSSVLSNRRHHYIVTKRLDKENSLEVLPIKLKEVLKSERLPLTNHNYNTRRNSKVLDVSYSPPVSPSKAKFRENQKIIRKLSPGAMTKCPRCGKPSPIITKKVRDRVVKIGRSTRSSAKKSSFLRKTVSESASSFYRTPFDQSQLFHFDSSGSDSSGSEKRIRRTLFPGGLEDKVPRSSLGTASSFDSSSRYSNDSSQDSFELDEYGLCSGKMCAFKFCVKCLLEYHPGQACRSSMEMLSPTKEEELTSSRGNLMCSRQSRRALKRLCS